MSLSVFAGSSQLVFINLWESGVNAAALALAVATVNLRLLIYGASLRPYLGQPPSRIQGLVRGYFLTDESYSVSMAHFLTAKNLKNAAFYYLGAAGPTYFGWQIAGIFGYLLGAFIPRSLPFSMAIPMVFLALLVSVVKSGKALKCQMAFAAVSAGLAAVAFRNLLPPGMGIIAAVFIGAASGMLLLRFSGER
jgi:predicted branched-subunit amino acid permease